MSDPVTIGDCTLYPGDCLDVIAGMDADSVDSITTDPPYGLEFMGKDWDSPWQLGGKSALFGDRKTKTPGGWGGTRNANCRRCGGRARGQKRCACEIPDWDEAPDATRIRQMRGYQEWCEDWAISCLRVLKPGGHLVAFGGTRTYHRLACAIEDAGFEIRDALMWHYGSGFPKNHDVSKAIDRRGGQEVGWFGPWLREWRRSEGIKQSDIAELFPSRTGGKTGCVANWELGFNLPTPEQFNLICRRFGLPFSSLEAAEREIVGRSHKPKPTFHTADIGGKAQANRYELTRAASDAAREWQGWGSALKPSTEICVLARKPLSEPTIAANVLRWGTGAINVDGCRVPTEPGGRPRILSKSEKSLNTFGDGLNGSRADGLTNASRWPANVLHDGSEEVLAGFPIANSARASGNPNNPRHGSKNRVATSYDWNPETESHDYRDSGSAARFFACFPQEYHCGLCCLPLEKIGANVTACDANNVELNFSTESTRRSGFAPVDVVAPPPLAEENKIRPKSENVGLVESGSGRCPPPISVSAHPNAAPLLVSQIAQNVRSAANLCALCATAIAQSLVAMRLGQDPASHLGRGFMPEHKRQILIQSLALYVAGRENTGTILTTESLRMLFGSVFYAIDAYTSWDEAENAASSNPDPTRFRYSSKASKKERAGSAHPTVKPVALMRWLCRLVTPPGGVVLDPFAGSGTTGEAAILEGFRPILIEREAEYVEDIRRRLAGVKKEDARQADLFQPDPAQEALDL